MRHGAMIGILLFVLCGYTRAGKAELLDPGKTQTGKAGNWRILWVGGYRQQGVYQAGQDERARAAAKKQAAKDKREQEADRRREREQAAKDRQAAQKAKHEAQEAARKARELKAKRCRGVGIPAGCTESNPGRGHK